MHSQEMSLNQTTKKPVKSNTFKLIVGRISPYYSYPKEIIEGWIESNEPLPSIPEGWLQSWAEEYATLPLERFRTALKDIIYPKLRKIDTDVEIKIQITTFNLKY